MSWRIAEYVSRGEVDNRVRGRITGTIWMVGRKDPIRLELEGDGGVDLAGRLLRFTNPEARPEAGETISSEQSGTVGEWTASKKVRIPTLPAGEGEAVRPAGYRWSNCLFLEWFSERNGRVLIEGLDYEATISEPAWEWTAAELAVRTAGAVEIVPGVEEGEDEETVEAIERVLRINDLKHEAEQLIGGEIVHTSAGPVPPEVQEKFWQEVVDFEKAPSMSRLKMLQMDGLNPRPLDGLSEAELHEELWGVIEGLARRRTFLDCTDHLSDRELYSLLIHRVLEESTTLLPADSEWSCHLSIHEYGEPGDEEGVGLYLRYYADEETRRQWLEDFPGDALPEPEDPPYDRDGKLPPGRLDGEAYGEDEDEEEGGGSPLF